MATNEQGAFRQPANWSWFQRSGEHYSLLTDEKVERANRSDIKTGDKALEWGKGEAKSYLIPALEIPAFVFALNGVARLIYPHDVEEGAKTYSTTRSTIWHNLTHGPWKTDQDAFRINQLGHPYQGTIYYGLARSTGHSFWESFGYTFAGSFLWEVAGETTHPSTNDQVASGIAGSFLGEPLFRISSLFLEGREKPGFWRELAATAISPPVGFNRLVFGERFDPVFPSHNPEIFWDFRIGADTSSYTREQGASDHIRKGDAVGEFSMLYGLPGEPGYHYERPFDFFRLEFTAVNSANDPIEEITTRGLLIGQEYEVDKAYRGVWGLYGSYDYLSPHAFRTSQTALSVGTNSQWWLSRSMALQLAALTGTGYGAAADLTATDSGPYHYGLTAHGILSLRLIFRKIAMLDLTARDLYVSRVASSSAPKGEDNIERLKVNLTIPIYGRHGLALQYVYSHRDAYYTDAADRYQTVGTFGLFYTFVSDSSFGAVEWRSEEER